MTTQRQTFIDPVKLAALNDKIYANSGIDREHLLELLSLIDTNDSKTIIDEVKKWLKSLHDDPKFSKVNFRDGDIEAIIGDLDSYGRVAPETILEYKQNSNRSLPLQ